MNGLRAVEAAANDVAGPGTTGAWRAAADVIPGLCSVPVLMVLCVIVGCKRAAEYSVAGASNLAARVLPGQML